MAAFFVFLAKAAIKYAVDLVITIAISAALNSLSQQSQKRPEGWTAIKQPVPPRHYAYGRGRKRGVSLLYESVSKHTIDVLAFCQGRCGSNVIHYFNDKIVPLNIDGSSVPQPGGAYGDFVIVKTNNGLPTEVAHANITAVAGALWTSTDRADGVVTAGMQCRMIKDDKMPQGYPNGEIEYSQARDWLCVYDWRKDSTAGGSGLQRRHLPATWAYNPNPVVCWVHDKWNVHGWDWDRRFANILDLLTEEADACDEAYPLAAGGTVSRYEIFFWYEADADPKDIDDAFMRATDGWMTELADGSMLFRVGRWIESPHIITDAMILDLGWTGGIPKSRLVNEIKPQYRVESLLYEMADTDAFVLPDSIEARGLKNFVFKLPEVTNNSQAMRLSKAKFAQLNARYTGQWVLDLDQLPETVFTHRFHRVQIADGPASLADTYVEFIKPRLDLMTRTLTVQVRPVDESFYDWTVEEEGGGVPVTDRPDDEVPAVPELFSVVVTQVVGGARLRLTFDEAFDDDFSFEVNYRLAGDVAWTSTGFLEPSDDAGKPYVETGIVPAELLEVQARASRTNGYSEFAPVPPENVDARPAEEAPEPPGSVFAEVGVTPGDVVVSYGNSSSPNLDHARIWYAAAGTPFGSAIDAGVGDGTPGTLQEFTITGLLSGAYDVWVTSETAGGLASDAAGPANVIVP